MTPPELNGEPAQRAVFEPPYRAAPLSLSLIVTVNIDKP
jgi:hypothetical protein